jgi:5-methylcytosine-specific restriction protein A
MAGIASLTDRDAVLKALAEYDRIGRDAFLARYRFGRAKRWYVLHKGNHYESKAIVGAAFGYQHGRPLTSTDFRGGEDSAVRRLRALEFRVTGGKIEEATSRLPEEVPQTFPEGLRTTVIIDRVERSPRARAACIEIHGTACVVCGMDFETAYGPEFSGLIHVHHLNPLAGRKELAEVDPRDDLRPVCPNCHAAIHFGGANRSLEEVRGHWTRSTRPAV